MILEPRCFQRKCKHFTGVLQDDVLEHELTERVVCKAFPQGIPDTISYGNDLHLKPVRGDNGIQFEPTSSA